MKKIIKKLVATSFFFFVPYVQEAKFFPGGDVIKKKKKERVLHMTKDERGKKNVTRYNRSRRRGHKQNMFVCV